MSGINLQQNLSQQQILSPQMRQSLEVLQATTLELGQILQQALAANPVLELDRPEEQLEEATPADAERDMETLSDLDDDFRELRITERANTGDSYQDEAARDFHYNSIVASKTLQQHLLDQLAVADSKTEIKQVASVLIGHLNDRGFLESTLEEIARSESFTLKEAERAQMTLQSFDPPGVAASDLTESLLIQLGRKGLFGSLAYRVVEDHLEDLARKKLPDIAKKLGVTTDAVTEAAEVISTLTPDPGAEFDPTSNPQVSPDLVIAKTETGEWEVQLSGDNIPDLSISNAYKDLMASTGDSETRQYLRQQIRDGKILIRSISQRQETLYKIGLELVKHQSTFLEKGAKELKPLTMNLLAESIEVHPATISRAVAGKYVLTPHGLVELRTFFTSGFTSESGQEVSNTGIRETIQQLVADENPQKPLSDSAIEKILKEQGIKVARRTIAKYRDQLNILPSHLRKKF